MGISRVGIFETWKFLEAKLPDLVWQNPVIVDIYLFTFIYIYVCTFICIIYIYTYFKNYQTEWGRKIPIHLKNRDFNPEFSAFSCRAMFQWM